MQFPGHTLLKLTYFGRGGAVALLLLFAGCSEEGKQARLLDRADKFAASGDYDAARIEYRNVLKGDPENARAIAQLGIIWMEEGSPMRAIPFLLRAREQSPEDLKTRFQLALAYRSLGNTAEARKEAKATLAGSPSHEEAIMLLAETARTSEELGEIKSHLQKLAASGDTGLGYSLGMAILAMRTSDLPSAEGHIQKALGSAPGAYRAHLVMARIREMQGNKEAAKAAWVQAAESSPARSHARLGLADFYRRTGDFPQARLLLEGIRQEAPGYIPAPNALARIALQEGDFPQAIQHSKEALAKDPANYDAQTLMAQAYLGTGETDRAVKILEGLDAQYPEIPPTKFQLAVCYAKDGRTADALAAVKFVLDRIPSHEQARLLEAQLRLLDGNPDAAITSLSSLLEKKPDSAPAKALLANAFTAASRFDEALAIHRERLKNSPEDARTHVAIGLIERARGNATAAREAFLRADELAPGNLSVSSQLIDIDLAENRTEGALDRSKRLVESNPESAPARYLQAFVETRLKNWESAESTLKGCLALDPDFGGAYSLLVSIYLETDRLEAARDELAQFLVKNPRNASALVTIAGIHEKLGDYAAARKYYETVLTIEPDAVVAQNNLAILCLQHFDDPDTAYQLATRARASRPDDPAIADTMGWVLFHRGEYRKALALIVESSLKLGENVEVQYHLGRARYAMGDTAAARDALALAVAGETEFPGKETARRDLQLLDRLRSGTSPSIEELQKLSADRPKDVVLQLALAASHERAGEPSKAVAAYEAALAVNPDLLAAHTSLAGLYSGPPLNDTAKALAHAEDARELAPDDPSVLAALGGSALRAGRAEWAYSLLRESARGDVTDIKVLATLARAAYQTGKAEEAAEVMARSRALLGDEEDVSDIRSFVTMLTLLRKPTVAGLASAKGEIEYALGSATDRLPALMLRAAGAALQGNRQAAMDGYRTVLEEFPEFPLAQLELARLEIEGGDEASLKRAADLAQAARGKLPGNARAVAILAGISFRQGEFDTAIRLSKEVADIGTLDAEGLAILGLSELQSGEEAAGRTTLRRALDMGLRGPWLEEVEAALGPEE